MRKALGVDMRIELGLPDGLKCYPAACAFCDLKHATPVRREFQNAAQMLLVANDCQLLKALLVYADLPWQSRERVCGAFDFKSVNVAVDHRNIDDDVGMR